MHPTDELIPILKKLRLSGVLQTLDMRLRQAVDDDLVHAEFLLRVLTDEVDRRNAKQIDSRLRRANFEHRRSLEDFDFTFNSKIPKNKIIDLATCGFIAKHENVCLVGQTGVGKSHIAQAIGHRACAAGYQVHYTSAHQMLIGLRAARADASLERKLARLVDVDLLIIDDLGLRNLTGDEPLDLYELIRQRYEKASTIITSNRRSRSGLRSSMTSCSPVPRWTDCSIMRTSSRSLATRTGTRRRRAGARSAEAMPGASPWIRSAELQVDFQTCLGRGSRRPGPAVFGDHICRTGRDQICRTLTLRSELENFEQEPLHVKAYANSGLIPGATANDVVFGEPTFDNTGGVISNGSSWYWEVPEDGVYLVHAMIAGDYASNGGDENEFYGVHIRADGETFALDVSRQNASCCRRHTTASSAQYLEAGQLVSVLVHNLSSMDFTVVDGSYIDITRLR